MLKSSRRDDIIKTALPLFCEYGFHATGVDRIMAAGKFSKKTLYAHFRSKDELIVAVLQYYDGLFRNNFMREVESRASAPQEKLLAIFDTARDWFTGKGFFGCMFINAVAEFSQADSPIRSVAFNFKRQMRAFMREICVEQGVDDPDQLADEIAMLLEGAIVTAQVGHFPLCSETAKKAAAVLIQARLAPKAAA